jgi:hypothetical protein
VRRINNSPANSHGSGSPQGGGKMFALNLTSLHKLFAVSLVVVAIIIVSLAIVEPASANTYGYYWRP